MSTGCEVIGETVDTLGESPIWSEKEGALYWVDIRGPFIRRRDGKSGQVDSWPMPSLVGCIGLDDRGGLIVALTSSICHFDPESEKLTPLAASPFENSDMRFNDGRVDRQGRFWVGSMNDRTRAAEGILFRMGSDLQLERQLRGIRCPNSLCWSADGQTMYFADSDLRTIFSYPFDPITGDVGEPSSFAYVDDPGVPDGCIVDSEGFLWCAIYGASKIVRFDPKGRVEQEVLLPVSQPTSCAFGDDDGQSLYVTTACQRLSEEERAGQPLAGRLLRFRTPTKGIPETVFSCRN